MIVLDTNVISELMRSQPHPAVTAWVAAQSRGSLYTTSVNEAELFYGISAMPEGRRRAGLAAGAEALFAAASSRSAVSMIWSRTRRSR